MQNDGLIGLVRSSLPLHIPLTGVPVILKSAQRIEESPRFAFRRNAMVKEGGAIITDSSDSCGIFRMTVATFLRNQNDGGSIPSKFLE